MKSREQYKSFATLAQLMLPNQANPAGNVHGGEILKIMDSAAGVSAQKHARTNVVTARIDEICFRQPIRVGELVTCNAHVIYAGRSSMEIFVTVESEDLSKLDGPQIALTAFFTMVSLDENGRPSQVAPLILSDNPYEKKLYYEGEKRYTMRNKRRLAERSK